MMMNHLCYLKKRRKNLKNISDIKELIEEISKLQGSKGLVPTIGDYIVDTNL